MVAIEKNGSIFIECGNELKELQKFPKLYVVELQIQ